MKQILTLTAVLFYLQLHAQPMPLPGKKPPKITIQKGWSLSLNPLAPFELLHTAIGGGIGYTFNNQLQVSTEINYLGGPLTSTTGVSKDLKGIRTIFALKRLQAQGGSSMALRAGTSIFRLLTGMILSTK
jgi:hypothetical protein